MVLCDRCGLRGARVFQAHSGLRLCGECFLEDVRVRVWGEVERWRMVEPGDVVLMALSGGKDSYVLLESLALKFKSSRLMGLSIVEGIPGYNRAEDVKALVETAKGYGVDVLVVSVKEFTGASVSEMVFEARRRSLAESACTFCGLSRRRIMDYYARALGATKLATAHNLDDEVQTLIVNIMRGDTVGVLKIHPNSGAPEGGVRRIKPLRKIYEWETAAYAMIRGFHMQTTECPFIDENPTLRAGVRRMLYEVEKSKPGSLLKALQHLDEVLGGEALKLKGAKIGACPRCGAPTSSTRTLCKLCELLEAIGIREPRYVKLQSKRLNVI
ncbi:MAG: TIGR00269 family protein [Acidilobaceae archaeon]